MGRSPLPRAPAGALALTANLTRFQALCCRMRDENRPLEDEHFAAAEWSEEAGMIDKNEGRR